MDSPIRMDRYTSKPESVYMPDENGIPRGRHRLLLAATVLTVLLMFMGGVVCIAESIGGCSDWQG